MSNYPGYPTKKFSETQKFFILDPNTQTPSFVSGADLVSYLTPSQNYVYSESTRTTAQATDYPVGALVETAGATSAGDNFAAVYLVVAAGEGDFPMDNGNELLVIKGDEFLREQLAQNTPGDGSDLVGHTGTTDTVTQALAKRTIYVGSVAEGISGLTGVDGQAYSVICWHPDSEIGGGKFVFREGQAKSAHNGGTIISPTVPALSAQSGISDYLNGVGETDPSGSGCFVRVFDQSEVSVFWFGAKVHPFNSTAPFQKSINLFDVVTLEGKKIFSESVSKTAGELTILDGEVVGQFTTISASEGYSRNILSLTNLSSLNITNVNFDSSADDMSLFKVDGLSSNQEAAVYIGSCGKVEISDCLFSKYLGLGASDSPANPIDKSILSPLVVRDYDTVRIERCGVGENVFPEGLQVFGDGREVIADSLYSNQTAVSRRVSTPFTCYGENVGGLTVKGCEFKGHGGSGLNIIGPSRIIIKDNDFILGRGIDISNEVGLSTFNTPELVLITGNRIDGVDPSYASTSVTIGVYVSMLNSGVTGSRAVISGNFIKNSERSIIVETFDSISISDNEIINTTGTGAGKGRAISARECLSGEIKNNKTLDSEETGILLRGCNGLLVSGNHLYSSGVSNIEAASQSGISDGISFSENVFRDGTYSGLNYLFRADSMGRFSIFNDRHINALSGGSSNLGGKIVFTSQFPYRAEHSEAFEDIADDSVVTFNNPFVSGRVAINTLGSRASEAFVSFSNAQSIFTSSMVVTTGALNGTTGTDGDFTFSVSSNTIYLENRSGTPLSGVSLLFSR